jgi:hypothetical protein
VRPAIEKMAQQMVGPADGTLVYRDWDPVECTPHTESAGTTGFPVASRKSLGLRSRALRVGTGPVRESVTPGVGSIKARHSGPAQILLSITFQ